MTIDRATLARRRLGAQRLVGTPFASAAEAVAWSGAVQAQDWAGAKWALAMRMKGATSASLDEDLAEGRILRTHVLRPTWHMVAPADLPVLLALTAERVKAGNAGRSRELGLDDGTYARANDVLAAAVESGARTRDELGAALAAAGIAPDGQRLPHMLMRAELDAVLVSGGLRGKQQTWVAFGSRVRPARLPGRAQVLAELVERWFASHGPATVHDFAWWSGLTVADAKAGLEASGLLTPTTLDGKTYWHASPVPRVAKGVVRLLPNYDELTVAYRDHGPSLHPDLPAAGWNASGDLLANVIALDGLVVGKWRRTIGKREVLVEAKPLVPLDAAAREALEAEAARYGTFLGLEAALRLDG